MAAALKLGADSAPRDESSAIKHEKSGSIGAEEVLQGHGVLPVFPPERSAFPTRIAGRCGLFQPHSSGRPRHSGIGTVGELTGLTMLTGEAGSGKTTLIYSLLQRDFKRVRIAHIEDPKLSFSEIMQVVLRQMNLYSTGSTKLEYLEALDKLLKLRGKEERIAIIVDESQLLSDDVLEELRLLSNRSDRSLQLILVDIRNSPNG